MNALSRYMQNILFFFCRDLELVELHASKDGGCDMRITAASTGSTGDDVSTVLYKMYLTVSVL